MAAHGAGSVSQITWLPGHRAGNHVMEGLESELIGGGENQMEVSSLYLKVPKQDIVLLVALLNSYDNMASVRTIDARRGIVHCAVPPGCEELITDVLQSLRDEILWEVCPLEEIDPKDRELLKEDDHPFPVAALPAIMCTDCGMNHEE